jgi:hypothetical protein
MENILRVRTRSQKVLFDSELSGQISDGLWENARPQNHYLPWCKAEVVVDPISAGRNFYASKDNYNFLAVIPYIGERMIEAVRVQTNNPTYGMRELRSDLIQLKKIVRQRSV